MPSPNLNTYREITPLIYSWSTPDISKYQGWEKIGYTEQESAEKRIAQQASQLAITKHVEWVRRAFFTSVSGGRFKDSDFHAYLKQQGIERELHPRTEWHRFADAPKTSLEYLNAFAGQDLLDLQTRSTDDYDLRPEQQAAVNQALNAFTSGHDEVLWNAKPRFGKTLTTYDLMRELGARKVLIVTNRPAIANSWFDDFTRFIGHQTTYKFVSDSPSLASRSPMSRDQWRKQLVDDTSEDPRVVEFVSLQDLKGSQYFGGVHEKLRHIADYEWDLLVIDEAHEGIDTTKTDVAFNQIKRSWTLHLSGTPFKALASGRFSEEQIFNWTYEDEQKARQEWSDDAEENPYEALPKLNMLTYQVSRMITDQLALGVALDEDEANIDFTFDLNEFFSTKDNGFFEHEVEVVKFLDCLASNEKYPFSTPRLRDEIRHSFWLLNRVASAKALQRLLKKHEVFKDYEVILAAGDGRDVSDAEAVGKSFDRVKAAIEAAEQVGGKTITLSVGQLTTGVTVPEWTAVVMLSNLSSPALYMQAAFRAQNPCTFMRGNAVFQKENAYIFDFAPERTLRIFDEFANNLSPTPSSDQSARQENIRTLLNFFPVIGEDSEGRMVELDAAQVLTFPQVFKAREVVRRGFLSNLLFANVAGIFRYTGHVKDILEKLPTAQQDKTRTGQTIELPEPAPTLDVDGHVQLNAETVINPKVAGLGKPVWRVEDIAPIEPQGSVQKTAREIAKLVTEKSRETRAHLQEEYSLSAKQVERDEKQMEARVMADVERVLMERSITEKRLAEARREAATEAEARDIEQEQVAHEKSFKAELLALVTARTDEIVPEVVTREETKKEQRRANQTMDDARSHLRGFARTIPMFLMAYGDRDTRLANFDDYTPDDVFKEITGITEEEFRVLRDGQQVVEEDGAVVQIPGMFDEAVFDKAVQEFLDKKEQLADYFDAEKTEDIFAYIPQQKTSLVFTPRTVVETMADVLEAENPGIFEDSTKTFADLFSTAGLFLMEIVRRLEAGLADQIPDETERLKHIFTKQIFEMSHNRLLHKITVEAVSGGVPERRGWIDGSGHFVVGNLAQMGAEERQRIVDGMLGRGSDGGALIMGKKFDVVIGNPPYQEEAQGSSTRAEPIYHRFMDAAHEVGEKVVLITPARFLSNSGQTPTAWNKKMLADEHLVIAHYESNSGQLFPGTDIKGGIVVTYRDATRILGPIGVFLGGVAEQMDGILKKVQATGPRSFSEIVSSRAVYRYSDLAMTEHPEIADIQGRGTGSQITPPSLAALADVVFFEDRPLGQHEYIRLVGLVRGARVRRWIRRDYVNDPTSLDRWKVIVAKSNNSGSFGETLSGPFVGEPLLGHTDTFLSVGSFDDDVTAEACLSYLKSKFARALLSVLKTTQDNPKGKWEHVPLQDFTSDSDIDWSKSIAEIDQQLYAKYKLDADEIEFIESHVKPMD